MMIRGTPILGKLHMNQYDRINQVQKDTSHWSVTSHVFITNKPDATEYQMIFYIALMEPLRQTTN